MEWCWWVPLPPPQSLVVDVHNILQITAFPSSTAPLHSADLCPVCTHQAGHLQFEVLHRGLP